MTEEEKMEQIAEKVFNKLMEEMNFTTNFVMPKQFIMKEGINIRTGKTQGTIIATESDQKLGFYGKTPVDQPALASDTLANLITALRELGIISN